VVGATAVGKSEFAVLACERFGGEIVSVDSMQVYRGLDRGTAKPDPRTLRRVPHHGIDLADPGEDFSLGDFVRHAEMAIASTRGRRRLPVLVGGTGLYLRGLLKGIVEAPPRDEALRARLRSLAERRGTAYLHRLLARVDPEAAARLRPADGQRLVRALEVYRTARRGLSDLIRESPFGPDRFASVKIGLSIDREALYRIIDARVERFFAQGLVEEVQRLMQAGHPESANAFKALGYRETLRHLRGGLSLEEAILLTQRNTRRYAKRQWTWFRKEEGVTWFEIDPDDPDRFRRPLAHAEQALGRK
jgi:tRNA dimethylallyltransferase